MYSNPNRVIRVAGEITEESFETFSTELSDLERTKAPITIELCSGGGSAEAALAYYSRIRLSKNPVTVYVLGYAASAATLILLAGDYRVMAREAWVMVHEEQTKVKGSVVDIERNSFHLRQVETQWTSLFSTRTSKSAKFWTNLHKQTTYLTADTCLSYGLIEKVI